MHPSQGQKRSSLPRSVAVKRHVLRLLNRLRLIGPAFRSYEWLISLRPQRVTPNEGPPLPPRLLRVRVAGTADADGFLRSGRASYDAIAAHVPLADVQALLDFGCGCGRVTRYFHDFAGDVSGSDVNAQAIDWCRGNLRFARFEVNGPAPPLLFADESFDLVYAYSVFTHLTAELQVAWRDELRRVLQPGGRLLVTTHGESYVARHLDEDERARFNAGELVVRWGEAVGSNLCVAYHPERYLRETFAQGFEFVELEPEGAPIQDLVLLRKR